MRTKLKILRVKNHLTQAQMAEKIGYTRSAYSGIENGLRTGRKSFWVGLQQAFKLTNSEVWELMNND